MFSAYSAAGGNDLLFWKVITPKTAQLWNVGHGRIIPFHRITEQFELEGTVKIIQFQLCHFTKKGPLGTNTGSWTVR